MGFEGSQCVSNSSYLDQRPKEMFPESVLEILFAGITTGIRSGSRKPQRTIRVIKLHNLKWQTFPCQTNCLWPLKEYA